LNVIRAALLLVALPLFAANLPSPAITSIHPPGGPVAGGTQVTIRGTYFQPGATVSIGGHPLINVVVESPGKITGTTVARPPGRGTLNIFLTNPNGAETRLLKAYTYFDDTFREYPAFTLTQLTGASTQPPPSVAAGAFSGGWNEVVAPAFDFISYFPGNATPQFLPVRTFDCDANISATEVLDLNGDGLEDVALAALGGSIRVMLGHTSTPLQQSIVIPSSAFAFALDSGDFNGDGAPDLVIPDHATGYVNVCVGMVGGGCSSTNSFFVTANPSGVTTGDFDGDSHLDMAVSDEEDGTVTILLGDGTGGFEIGSPIAAGTAPTEVMGLAAGYLDGDAILDLAVSTGAILLGNGDGTFAAGAALPVGGGRHVVIGDFNRDGKRDIAIDTSLTSVHVLLGDGNGRFPGGPTINTPGGLYDAFAQTDINADGQVDLIIGGAPVAASNNAGTCPTITLSPSTLADGTAGSAYSVTFTQSGGSGTMTYSLSGALPNGMAFAGGTLSGTPLQAGDFPVAVTVVDPNGCSRTVAYELTIQGGGTCPTNLIATATSAGSVSVTWNGVSGATSYQIWRSSAGQAATHVATSSTTSYNDLVTSGKTFRYFVRAVFGSQVSCASGFDIATTIIFEDPDLIPGVTAVKLVHLTELRTAVNAVRAAAGLPAYSFTTIPAGSRVRTVYIHELRSALAQARTSLGLPSIAFTDHPLVVRVTPIRAVHLTELRDGVR
jgi:hypothetical protein